MMNLTISTLLIIFTLVLSGCGPSTYNQMIKNDSTIKKEYIIKQNYQILYKNALEMTGQCWDSPAYIIRIKVNSTVTYKKLELINL